MTRATSAGASHDGPARGAARSIAGETRHGPAAAARPAGEAVTEVPMEDLRYKMIMALNAADIGNPICEQAAQICAEIAEQYCAQLHVTTTAQVIATDRHAVSGPLPARLG